MQAILKAKTKRKQILKPLKRGFPVGGIQFKRAGWAMEKLSVAFLSEYCPFQPYPRSQETGCQWVSSDHKRDLFWNRMGWRRKDTHVWRIGVEGGNGKVRGGGGGMSSRAADSDRTAKKVTLAPEHAATPPALPCARTALTRKPALHIRTRRTLQACLLARLQRCAHRRWGGPGPSIAQGSSSSSGARRRVTKRTSAGANRRCPPRPELGRKQSGGPRVGRDRGGVTLLHPFVTSASIRCFPASRDSRLEKHTARKPAPGACAR